jgi:hypothetical protein
MYNNTKTIVILNIIVEYNTGSIGIPDCNITAPTNIINVKIPSVSNTAFFMVSELTFLL